MSDDDDTYEVPLQDQRVFGAGIKRQRVKFVPASSSSSTIRPIASPPAQSVSELYLGLVLPREGRVASAECGARSITDSESLKPSMLATPDIQVCDICNQPLPLLDNSTTPRSHDQTIDTQAQTHIISKPQPHEASLAHQVCLAHSHPPSHLDRNRKGLAYLSTYGWDPDSGKGLGVEGQGIQFPIKTKPKDDKLGIGVVLPKPGDIKKKEKLQKLDAGKVRKLQEKDKRKGERLREMFYQSEDVEKYLGAGGRS